MKQGWEIRKLGDVGTFQRGGGFIKSDFADNGYPCIHYGQIHTKFDIKTDKHITCISNDLVTSKSKIAQKGDIIIAITSEDVQGSCKCTAWMGDYDVVVGAHAAIYKHTLNPSFVAYYLRSQYFSIEKAKYTHGFKVVEIKPSDIAKIDIRFPSLAEQERIVGILDKEFERIDALRANAERNIQHAKDLFQSALKQELQPKEGWTVQHLEKISTFSQGVQVEIGKQSTEMQDGYMRFLRIVDFTQGNEPPRYVGITDEKYQVKKDSLSVVRYGASAGFICTGLEGVIANNIFRIVPKKDILISNTFLYYVLISDIFQSVIRDSVNGAAMPAISFGMIKNIDIPYPSIDEQQSIVVRLDKLKEHCSALEENYTKTIALCDDMKQALLRKAFNGEL